MTVSTNSQIVAADYVSTSSGAGDSGKIQKFDSNGKIGAGFNYVDLLQTGTYGMTIAANDALYVADGGEADTTEVTSTTGASGTSTLFDATTDWLAQTFTFPSTGIYNRLKQIKLSLSKSGSPTSTMTVALYAVDGSNKPTGSALSSGTLAASSTTGSQVTYTITMTSYDMVAGTTYAIVLSNSGGTYNGTNFVSVYFDGTNPASGVPWYSANSGSTWAAPAADGLSATGDIIHQVVCSVISGRMYKTSASTAEQSDNFVGFAYDAGIAADASKKFMVAAGAIAGFTGLTVGSLYYLSNTRGAIATSAGSTSRKVGIALTSTVLVYKPDNQ